MSHRKHARLPALTLGAVGVVYGDIGTSPLYAFRESLAAAKHGGELQPDMVLGVLSLILWALIVIVTLKYVLLLLRADNNGEGGDSLPHGAGAEGSGQQVVGINAWYCRGGALLR